MSCTARSRDATMMVAPAGRELLRLAIEAQGGPPMGERLKAAIRRWQERRRQRRIELRERRNTARTTLRDYKRVTGHEGGTPGPLG